MQTKKNVPGVGIILINKGKFLLQLRDNKPDISNPNVWGLVGGAIEKNESPTEAIKRECLEEIGIVLRDIKYLGHTMDNKFRFRAYLGDEEIENLILGEGQEIRFFLPNEILKLETTPRVKILFEKYGEAVNKLINQEEVTAEDLGLEK